LLKGDARVLEVGCGDGSLLSDLRKRNPQLKVEGLDMALSREAVERCAVLGIPVMETAVENAELGQGRFDLIIMNQVIEHVPDPVTVMKKLAEALKQGGCVSIETPNLDGYDRRLFRKSFWGGYYFPRHLHLFQKESLKGLVEKSGLTVVQQSHLLAPIIWIFSVHAFVSQMSKGKCKREGQSFFFSDRNPFCLALFTLVDLLARLTGLPTSNQKIIARK
jgi:SAM-dependent methyltransferase